MGFDIEIGDRSSSGRNAGDGSSNDCRGGISGFVYGLIFTLVGTVLAYAVAYPIWQAIDSYSWEGVPGQVERSEVKVDSSKDTPFEVEVTYTYLYNGKKYRNSEYTLRESSYNESADAYRESDLFRSDSRPTVYVDPDYPSTGVLVRGRLWLIPILVLFPLVFLAIGLFFLHTTFSKSKSKQPFRKKSISKEAADSIFAGKWRLGLGIGFCSIFIVIGVLVFYFGFLNSMMRYLASKYWKSTSAVVENSAVRVHSDDDGTTYRIDILYAYQYAGKEYKSNRFSFFDFFSSEYNGKKEVVDQHPKGKQIQIYLDPDDPIEAVIIRELRFFTEVRL